MNADSGPGSLTLTNTTVTANHATAGQGGGLFWTPPATFTASATLLNTTFDGNTAIGTAGNIYAGGAANPKILVKNTIITGGSPNNCDHALGSQGHNLESANDCGFNVLGDLINKNPLLAPLQNYGGFTMTRLLKPGSPAIDAGTNTGCPAVDQRGQVRPLDSIPGGAVACDIGAVEVPAVKLYLPISIK